MKTVKEFLDALATTPNKWVIGGEYDSDIRDAKGRCPLVAIADLRKLIPRDQKYGGWEDNYRLADGLVLPYLVENAIIGAADGVDGPTRTKMIKACQEATALYEAERVMKKVERSEKRKKTVKAEQETV